MRKNIKIKAVSFQTKLGQVKANLKTIKEEITKAEEEKVNILLFPELSLTGASLYDAFRDKNIILESEKALKELEKFSEDFDLLFTVGLAMPIANKLYNVVSVVKSGSIIATYRKRNLKSTEKLVFDTEFDEFSYPYRTIELYDKECIEVNGIRIGISIGEDEERTIPNSLSLKERNADIILNPSADTRYALSQKHLQDRIKYLSKDVVYVYASSGFGESSTDYVYEGLSLIADNSKIETSERYGSSVYIKDLECESMDYSLYSFRNITDEDIKVHPFPYLPEYEDRQSFCQDVLEIQALGLLTRMNHISCKEVVLGLSGGLDSTMTLLAIVKAFEIGGFDKNGIHLYTMPAFGTSDRTKSNAYKLSQALGLEIKEINITDSVKQHLQDIGHDLETKDSAYENAQARERTQVLLDIANMLGAIVIGTGDLSEISQGFATYNGDHISNYSLNSTLAKTEIRYIIRYFAEISPNEKLREVLTDILDTPVSPELVKEKEGEISQKTENIVGPYELIDFFVYETLDLGYEIEKVLKDAQIAFKDKYDKETVKKWLISYYKRFTSSQFKRSCSVDGPATRKTSFSPRVGYRIASDMDSDLYINKLK